MSTIKDVATRAGVSQSTVFYALSGKRSVSQAVRQRVADAVSELNYTASALGQRLRRGRSHTIGMVCPWPYSTSDWLVMELISATAETVNKANHMLGFFMRQLNPEEVLELVQNQVADGLILMQIRRRDPRVEALRRTDYPFAIIGRTANLEGLAMVDFDYDQACYLAFEHLARLGHTNIGYIAPAGHADPGYLVHIHHGFVRARAAFDVTITPHECGPTIEDGFAATQALLETNPRITAIFASRGSTHIGAIHALHARKLRVPDDCSVIGISTPHGADWTIPRLTSVDVPLAKMGQIGAQLVLRKLAGETVTDQVLLPARVVVRDSTAPPRSRPAARATSTRRP
jgi:DNA-binding LacI/PurR family transcriptional regulator